MSVPSELIWLFASSIIALHSWALIGMIRLSIQMRTAETEIKRITKDIENLCCTAERLLTQIDQLKDKLR